MGGFHPSLCPDEVARFAEAVVIGEAEEVWPRVLDDARHGRLEKYYRSGKRPALAGLRPDRSIFRGKRYLPIGLVEAGRGCHFKCDFCAVQTVFAQSQTRRPADDILAELRTLKGTKKLFFFVDDNITSNLSQAKEFFRALIPLGIRWVGQSSINAAHDEEFLELLTRSGCMGVLIGFESLNPANLAAMNKTFNTARGGFAKALGNLRKHRIRVYGTFVFGYDGDTPESFAETVEFAQEHAFYHAVSRHAALPPPRRRTPPALRRVVAGRPLYLQSHSLSAARHEPAGFAARLPRRAPALLLVEKHRPARARRGEPGERIHVAKLFSDQRAAPRRRELAR
jgi:radical SAM superfamily enzyme YgiQ (UPF0313 family)